jgi:hypothetical protein
MPPLEVPSPDMNKENQVVAKTVTPSFNPLPSSTSSSSKAVTTLTRSTSHPKKGKPKQLAYEVVRGKVRAPSRSQCSCCNFCYVVRFRSERSLMHINALNVLRYSILLLLSLPFYAVDSSFSVSVV